MIHIYKDELDEINIKLITNRFIKAKGARIITFGFWVTNFENLFALD